MIKNKKIKIICPYCSTNITDIDDEIKICPVCNKTSVWSHLYGYPYEEKNNG